MYNIFHYFYIIALINFNILNVYSHSWISCTNYNLDNPYQITTSINYDINKCHGFARNYNLQYMSDINRGFGFDTGYNHRSDSCAYPFTLNHYNENLKMSKYTPGQQVCLTYPSKTHVADQCSNLYIPDNGIRIFRSLNKQSDQVNLENSKEYIHMNGNHVIPMIDYKGFQNCPGFCNNPDKTVCYVCFNLEENIESGIYSFKWIWEFNKNEFYSTCWDAEIINNGHPSNNSKNSTRNLTLNNYQYNKNNLCKNKNIPSMEPVIPLPQPIPDPIPVVPLPQSDFSYKKSCKSKSEDKSKEKSEDKSKEKSEDKSKEKSEDKSKEKSNDKSENKDTAKVWEQCGGNGVNNKECINSKCIKYSPYYSQCLPDKLEKNALCGQDDNKEIKWKYNVCINGLNCLPMQGSMDYRCI
jgi:hypothetical protein